jgi:thioesterase domain-containing protein/acyl carrier protein
VSAPASASVAAPESASVAAPESAAAAAPPRDELELALVQLWEEILERRPIGVRDDFFALGGHSLVAVRIAGAIRQRLGREIAIADVLEAPTVEALAQRLRGRAGAVPWSPRVRLQAAGEGRPFFCVHPAGGAVLCFADLARELGADRPFYGLQAAGLHPGQAPHARVEDMAEAYLAAAREAQPRGPYLLGGWSLGGLVALEMAQQLSRAGERVALLALIDTPARPVEAAAVREEPAALDPEERRRWLAVLDAHIDALRRYAPARYPGRITLLRAAELPPGVAAPGGAFAEPDLGWSALSPWPVEVHVVPGHHHSMVREPHARVLAARLRACIAAAS